MKILFPTSWKDYELIDCGDGYKLERYGDYTISRPEPDALWHKKLSENVWKNADATFLKTKEGTETGRWIKKENVPSNWSINYDGLKLIIKLSPFKHTGIFPEQAVHWDFMKEKIQQEKRSVKILNLFGYTGAASLVCAKAGAQVVHVDASKPTIVWARENQKASNINDLPIRWIEDDVYKFVQREVRRNNKYDGIIMDPPAFGHGPQGQLWKFSSSFPKLLSLCSTLLSESPIFIIINAYAISSSFLLLENLLKEMMQSTQGSVESGELALKISASENLLSTGIFARWSKRSES